LSNVALYGCTMPLKEEFEKWLVFICEITEVNIEVFLI